jgi:hypothetical protein
MSTSQYFIMHATQRICLRIPNTASAANLWSASLSLNAGWDVAFLPLSHPWLSKTTAGDAQIADQIFSVLICSSKISSSSAEARRRSAPGMPPCKWERQGPQAIGISGETQICSTDMPSITCKRGGRLRTGRAMASKDCPDTSAMNLSATSSTFRDISTWKLLQPVHRFAVMITIAKASSSMASECFIW